MTAFLPSKTDSRIKGAGLGLRRDFMAELQHKMISDEDFKKPDFFEIAPENWIGMGGRYARDVRE